MELRHLRYFVAVAEELHFRRAAQRLHLAQPALSQQIKDLEQELGSPLFRRSSRHVELTEAGRIFLQESRTILNQLAEAVDLVRRSSGEAIGQLKIGFATSASYTILPDLLRHFGTANPHLELICRDMPAADQLEALRKGEMDIGILRLPAEEAGVIIHPLLSDGMVMILPRNHPAASQTMTTLKDFSQDTFILFPRLKAPGAYDHIISCCRKAGFSPVIGSESPDMQAIYGFVSAGLGVSIGPASLQNMQRADIAYVPLDPRCGSFELGLAVKEGSTNSHIETFIRVSQEIARQRKKRSSAKKSSSRNLTPQDSGPAFLAPEGNRTPSDRTNGNGSGLPKSKPHYAVAAE